MNPDHYRAILVTELRPGDLIVFKSGDVELVISSTTCGYQFKRLKTLTSDGSVEEADIWIAHKQGVLSRLP